MTVRPSGSDGADNVPWVQQVSGGLTTYLVAAAANLGLPWILASPLSETANSMRAIVVGAGILLALTTLVVGRDARSRTIVAKSAGLIMLSVVASPSVRWADLGPGTFGMLALFSIPALAKLIVHVSQR